MELPHTAGVFNELDPMVNQSIKVKIEDQNLESWDALGLWDTNKFSIEAISGIDLLVIEVPMID